MNNTRGMVLAFSLAVSLSALGARAVLAEEQEIPPKQHWSFAGPLGIYDPAQLQRGFQVYKEVCSNCHSIKLLAFRNLADPGGPGFTEAQANAIPDRISRSRVSASIARAKAAAVSSPACCA